MYRIRIKKAPKKTGDRLASGDQPGFGLLKGNAHPDLLPKAQDGRVIDHYKQQMLKKYGKYLITDKGGNRTYYGYPGSDGKITEGDFEVLTGATGNNNYYVPYSLSEVESKSKDFQKKLKVTPVGTYPLHSNANIYGYPGLNIDNTGGLAMHTTYDPAVRNAFYNNNNPADNYASYGCINCRKPDLDKVLKGFGNNDHLAIIDSRKSVEDNLALAKDNQYLYDHPEAARMLFENPAAHFARRTWNASKGLYEGEGSDYDPYTETIIEKKELAPATVVAIKPRSRQLARKTPERGVNSPTPLQQNMAENPEPVSKQYLSVVDYLNNRGIDASKANRMKMAHELGIDDYNYRAEDNLKLLNLLQEQAALAMQQNNQPIAATGMEVRDQANTFPLPFTGRNKGHFLKQNDNGSKVRTFLPSTDRSMANIEAEKGETVWGDFDGDAIGEHYKIGGERHGQGGTPLRVPEGSFVFSDTRKMRIGGPILKEFGKDPNSKKKYTPADLAKQYNVNKFKAVLGGEQSDRLDKDTAQLMLDNYQQKLGKLAFVQESMKGFPQGIPSIALPFLKASLPEALPEEPVKAQYGRWVQPYAPESSQQNRLLYPWLIPGQQLSQGTTKASPPAQPPGQWVRLPANNGVNNNSYQNTFLNSIFPGSAQWFPVPTPGNQQQAIPQEEASASKQKPATKQQKAAAGDPRTRSLYGDARFTPIVDGEAVYPQYIKDRQNVQVPWMQHKRSDGTYGSQDWEMSDFYQRHPWIKKEHPGFNPRNPNDVKWFQNAYNDRYRDIWGLNYFNERGHLKVDGKFGQGTYSAPGLTEEPPTQPTNTTDKKEPPKTKSTTEKQPSPQVDQTPLEWKNYQQQRMPWWSQDMINMGAAVANRYDIKKYMPTYVTPGVYLPNPTFFDPTRQLAANQESAAQQGMLSALYAGPQRFRSIGSQIQGQGAANAANTLGQVQNQNVGIANQFELGRTELLNNKALRDAIAKKTYMDEVTALNQNYDNAKRLGNENMRMNLLSGITNSQKTHWLNRMNSQFEIDPTSGRIYFKKGKNLSDDANTPPGSNPLAVYNGYYEQFINSPYGSSHPDWANDFAMRMAFGNKGAQTGNGMNPEALAMLQMYGTG